MCDFNKYYKSPGAKLLINRRITTDIDMLTELKIGIECFQDKEKCTEPMTSMKGGAWKKKVKELTPIISAVSAFKDTRRRKRKKTTIYS